MQDCEKCNGYIPNCKRFSATFENEQIVIHTDTCAKSINFAKNRRTQEILAQASVPKIFTKFTAKDFVKNGRGDRNPTAIDKAADAIFDDKSLFIYGEAGTGKTMLAAIIANERAAEGKKSTFANIPDILESLREFNQQDSLGTRQEKLNILYRTKCLILDDLGAEKPSDWTCETLFKIINRRYNDGSQIIITSNYNINELSDHMNYTAGDRIIRRICDMCEPIQIF